MRRLRSVRRSYLPTNQLIQGDKGQSHLEETRPQNRPVLCNVCYTRCIGTHEVDNVARATPCSFIVAESEGLLVNQSHQRASESHASLERPLEVLVQERGLGDCDGEHAYSDNAAVESRLGAVRGVGVDEHKQALQ